MKRGYGNVGEMEDTPTETYQSLQRANEVDGIANTVEMYDEEMNVDATYQIGENEFMNDEGMHDHWDEDQVYVPVEEEPVTGPSRPFQFGSLPHSL